MHSFIKAARKAAFVLVAAALSACGGGGGGSDGGGSGDTLQVSLSYSGNGLLFRPSTIAPALSGLNGHAPNCSLKAGTLPAGLRLNGDCSVTGTPTQAGSFPITVHLTAEGVSNTLDFQTGILVLGPSVVYSMPSMLTAGGAVEVPTLNRFWTAGAGDTVQYSVAGNLPPGLAIDATTGTISGTPTTAGDYQFKVQVVASNGGNTSTQVQDQPTLVTVTMPNIYYRNTHAWAGIAFSSAPELPAGSTQWSFSAPALPAGLAIDAATGVISGTPTTPSDSASYPITVTATGAQGGSFSATTQASLVVDSPVYILYNGAPGRTGVPYSDLPRITNNYTNNFGGTLGLTYAYALDPASSLLAGLAVNPVTGEISGTSAVAQSLNFTVNVTVTLNGVSFVVPALGSVSIQ